MGKLTSLILGFSFLSLTLFTSGCASIISGTRQSVAVKSNPDGAKATFYNKKTGEAVSTHVTPCTVTLPRKINYNLTIEKENYAPLNVEVSRGLNGWYFGNVVFGGLIGLLIVDPVTGAMWHLSPHDIQSDLSTIASGKPSILIEKTVVQSTPAKENSGFNSKGKM